MPRIVDVHDLGLDALSNLFVVYFDGLSNLAGGYFSSITDDELMFRIQDFPIPASGVNTYEINWWSQTFERPGGKIDAPRELSLNIRIDQNWKIYTAFMNWKQGIANMYNGNLGDVTNNNTATLIASPVVSDGTIGDDLTGFKFEHVWPKNIGEVSFDHSSGDPIVVPITFGFLRIDPTVSAEIPATTTEQNGEQ